MVEGPYCTKRIAFNSYTTTDNVLSKHTLFYACVCFQASGLPEIQSYNTGSLGTHTGRLEQGESFITTIMKDLHVVQHLIFHFRY